MADKKEIVRSDTTGCYVRLYSHQNDPILLSPDGIEFKGRTQGRTDKLPTLISAVTSNTIGGSGTWAVTCKPANSEQADIFEQICDDDWVDIVFTRFDRQYHVMRGLVDGVRRQRNIGGTGATSRLYTIYGRDLTKVWEQTLMWFDMTTSEMIGNEEVYKIANGGFLSGKNPTEMVRAILKNAFDLQAKFGRANWAPPATLPGATADSKFFDIVDYKDSGFTNTPSRRAVQANTVAYPSGASLWNLAQEWSDHPYCELFTDTYRGGVIADISDGEGAPQAIAADSKLAVVFRDCPFPTVAKGLSSPWFELPLFIVPPGQLGADDLGRDGNERFNAFIAAGSVTQEQTGSNFDIIRPLWNKGDIGRHGLRRFDITARYLADARNNMSVSAEQRELIRDWNALNAYMLNGTLPLIVFRPDIRIGCRVRVPDYRGPEFDETFYVESVTNTWQHNRGRTTLTVTRGFVGTDNMLLGALETAVGDYELAGVAVPASSKTSGNA